MMRNRYTAAITDKPWWLAGGIPRNACVAAYQAAGAPSLAASYTNLAKPGTYTLTLGDAPDWDATNGWKFNGTSNYLRTGITIDSLTWSLIIRLTNVPLVDQWAIGFYSNYGFGIQPRSAEGTPDEGRVYYYKAKISTFDSSQTEGVYALTPTGGYYNGISDGALTVAALNYAEIWIGDISGAYRRYYGGYMQAAAIYKYPLWQSQVAALTTAMNTL